jgi:hypothetical protein
LDRIREGAAGAFLDAAQSLAHGVGVAVQFASGGLGGTAVVDPGFQGVQEDGPGGLVSVALGVVLFIRPDISEP